MVCSTRSSKKSKDDEDDDSKGSSSKKHVNSGAITSEASVASKSTKGTLSKKTASPSSSSGIRKSERIEKQTSDSSSVTPPAKGKSDRIEKQNDVSPLRRSERAKMHSLSGSSGSKMSDKSLDSLDTTREQEKKENSVKQLTMETVEVNKIEQEQEQTNGKQEKKKKMNAHTYRALFKKETKRVGRNDQNDGNRIDSGRRVNSLVELSERTGERTMVTSTSQSLEEALEENIEHNLQPTSQKDSCNGISEEVMGDAQKPVQENFQCPRAVCSIPDEGMFDFDNSLKMGEEGHDTCMKSVASPMLPSKNLSTPSGAATVLSSGCKRKDCSEIYGTCSKRQRVDCGFFNTNQSSGTSIIKDRGNLDVGRSTAHIERPCNYTQQHMSSADLQTGSDQTTCFVCKLDGKLLCCRGKECQRSCHLSCLEPSLEEFPLGVWYCPLCVRKKIESGVHSVSEGIEAIWDSRELEASEDGLQRHMEYFVEYKGLAHAHNCWVPENQVLLEDPSLIEKYKKKQGAVWKQHWKVPRRVLQKRLLIPKEYDEQHHKEHDGDKLNYCVEWLVKWCGLGYEHASWELENASFFSCPEGQSLIRDYETRRQKAKRASNFDEGRAAGVLTGLDANLDAANKPCTYWHSDQNYIVFDYQERIPNVVSSILSFLSDVSRPFLIISTSSSQYLWDDEFFHLAPSTDVVVYSGGKEIRNSIRNLEFYEGGGCIMFQVLITTPEVINEDLNVLDCIGWEAVIVDECQCPRIASCFEQIKTLTARKRLLIVCSALKEQVAEYRNLLSLLDSRSDSNFSNSLLKNPSDNIVTLKERLMKYVPKECKLDLPRFVEYWVPVLISNVQLEQYCFTLVSNSLSLSSPTRTDPVGVLRNILLSSRKCCDHPYAVDPFLRKSLTGGLKGVDLFDFELKASGKLQLLDAMLLEIKKRELKVLILFQYIGGSKRDLMGDILDDVLRYRFGSDSYERIDGDVLPSKKQSALNRFNNEKGRFVFLLETHACLSSIKLSAVDTVIIFGSDWSPLNDLKALQRIRLDSQFEPIKVFRLYSAFTVEEKALMLSKQDKRLDSYIENISPSNCHILLKWGASYLFSQLDKFHGNSTLDSSTLSVQSHLNDVIQEFFILLHQNATDNDASKLSLILQTKHNQGMYRTEMPLFGEQRIQVTNEDPPHIFWTKLLGEKRPSWKYFSCSSESSQRKKRVQHIDDLWKEAEAKSPEVVKRHKKVATDGNDHFSSKAELLAGNLTAKDWGGSSGTAAYGLSPTLKSSAVTGSDKIQAASNALNLANDSSKAPASKMIEWENGRRLRDLQKNLHVLLGPEIAKLCGVLRLSKDVKAMVERFLEYVMNNHVVNSEPVTILQAFQISLCWTAGSLLKQKINHKESLRLAKQHLGFTCKKDDAEFIYLMLRSVKRLFLFHTGFLKAPTELSSKASGIDYSNATSVESGFQDDSDIHVTESGVAPVFQLAQRDLMKSINEIKKKCEKQMIKLMEKQEEEMKQFNQEYKEEKAKLEDVKNKEAAVNMTSDKLKDLDIKYAKKFDQLKQKMDLRLKSIEALQVEARSNLLETETRWIEAVKSWSRVDLAKPPEVNLSEGRTLARAIPSSSGSEIRSSKIVNIIPDEVTAHSDPINVSKPYKENSNESFVGDCNVVCSGDAEKEAVYKDFCPREHVSIGEIPDGGFQVDVPMIVSSVDVTKSVLSMICSDKHLISDGSKINMLNGDPDTVSSSDALENLVSPNGSTSSNPNRDVSLKAVENVGFCEVQEQLASLLGPEKISDIGTSKNVDGETRLRESGNVISSEGQKNLLSSEEPSSVKIPDGSNLNEVDGHVPRENLVSAKGSSEEISDGVALVRAVGEIHLKSTKTVNSGSGQENHISLESPSSGEIPDGITLSNFDDKVQFRAPETVGPGMSLLSLATPLEEVPGRTELSMVDGEFAMSAPDAVTSGEGQGNIMSANFSSDELIPDGATLNVPNGDVFKGTSEIASSSDGIDITVCTNPAKSKELPAEEVSLAEPETAADEGLEGGRVHRENDGIGAMETDQPHDLACTMNRESGLEVPSLADPSSVQPVPTSDEIASLPPELVSPTVGSLLCASSEMQPRDLANKEPQFSYQIDGTSASNGAIDATDNMSNPNTSVVDPRAQMQQLRSTESNSNLSCNLSVTEFESNEGQNANQISQAPRQLVANHMELSNQDSLQSVHSHGSGAIGGPHRPISVPFVSGGLPVQTAPAVPSQVPLPSYHNHDPLQNEMERLSQERDRIVKVHEDTKLQLKLEREKEIVEVVAQIRKKYEAKLKEKETEFLLQKKELDENCNKVFLNKILAEAFRSKCMDKKAQQETTSSFMQQLSLLSSQQMGLQPLVSSGPQIGSATSMHTVLPAAVNAPTMAPPLQPSTASGPLSVGSATCMQTVSPAVAGAQTMAPPLPVSNTSAIFSGTATRPPHISSISPSTGNLPVSSEIRAPAPHLQPFRLSASISPGSLPLQSYGVSSQQAFNNHPVAPTSLQQSYGNSLAHNRQASTTGQSARIHHNLPGGLATPSSSSLPALDVLMDQNNLSAAGANLRSNLLQDVSSSLFVNQESRVPSVRSNPALQHGATDIVYLSDDD